MSPVTAIVPYGGTPPYRLATQHEDAGRTRAAAPQPRAPLPPKRMGAAAAGLHRPSAAFLAQLIAASRNLPQARERRRAEPREAIAAYAAAEVLRAGR